jgi:hypothetical protein
MQGRGEIDDLDAPRAESAEQVLQNRHQFPIPAGTRVVEGYRFKDRAKGKESPPGRR